MLEKRSLVAERVAEHCRSDHRSTAKRQKRTSACDLDCGPVRPHDVRRATETDAEMVVTLLDSLAYLGETGAQQSADERFNTGTMN